VKKEPFNIRIKKAAESRQRWDVKRRKRDMKDEKNFCEEEERKKNITFFACREKKDHLRETASVFDG